MADTDTDADNQISEDDWAAAMEEQSAADAAIDGAGDDETSSDDDWAAAMQEQAEADKVAADLASAADSPYQAKPASQLFPDFGAEGGAGAGSADLDMILDIPVQITVELGRTKLSIRNLLQLAHGSVVELDGLAGEPMDVLVNGTLIAQGEVVVVNEKFGIRLTDIITPSERMRKLRH
ncbi:MAG: flagellar motor switch protein FliN [Rhodocyclaceae bacterium]|nr:flagellar motor switch protein FliN [Rhodocyclaceae bacterium]